MRPEIRYQRQQLSGTMVDGDYFAGDGRNQVTVAGMLFYTFGKHH